MKKIFFFVIILFSAMLTACATQPTSISTRPETARPTASATLTRVVATFTATNIPATSIRVIACATTTTQCATFTPRPTKANTKTPQPSPTANIRENCINIEPKMPADLTLSGMWVVNMVPPYLEDINTHTRNGILMRGGGNIATYGNSSMAISPDGTTLAYIDDFVETSGPRLVTRSTKRILRVTRSSGYTYNMDYWSPDWQSIIGWVDNENLALAIANAKPEIVILNPATGKWKKFEQPAWAIANHQKAYQSHSPYNPTLDWFLENGEYYQDVQHLKNVKSGETTWQTDKYLSQVVWSANGKTLTFSLDDSMFVLKDGIQTDKLETERLGYGKIWLLKLSPDGQKLAFSSSKKIGNDYYNTETKPTLYNTVEHKLSRLCAPDIETSDSWWNGTIVWSPDSRYFVQSVYDVSVDQYGYSRHSNDRYLLVDTQEMRAYFLENGPSGIPIAWMAKQ